MTILTFFIWMLKNFASTARHNNLKHWESQFIVFCKLRMTLDRIHNSCNIFFLYFPPSFSKATADWRPVGAHCSKLFKVFSKILKVEQKKSWFSCNWRETNSFFELVVLTLFFCHWMVSASKFSSFAQNLSFWDYCIL